MKNYFYVIMIVKLKFLMLKTVKEDFNFSKLN